MELLDGDALLVDGDVTGGDDVARGTGDVNGGGYVRRDGGEMGCDVTGSDDTSDALIDIGGREGSDATGAGPDCAVGLIRLKARLAERLGYTVWWEV